VEEKMPNIFDRLDDKKGKDIGVLGSFIDIFCMENHQATERDAFPVKDARLRDILGERELVLCKDCSKLLNHGIAKLLLCPYDPKPMCKECQTHCYAPGYREKIRQVMIFSSLHLIKQGRPDLIQ
jgi:hypothetical protein